MKAQDIIDRVRDTLFDDAPGAGWSDAELLRYINTSFNAIVAMKPNARVVMTTMGLSPGIQQALPSDGVILIDAFLNTDNDSVSMQSLHEAERVRGQWAQATAGPTQFVFYDLRAPKRFLVFPKASSGDELHIIYAKVPDAVTAATDPIDLEDNYELPILLFVQFRAWMKVGPRRDAESAKAAYASFREVLADIVKGEVAIAAKVDLKGEA